MRIIENFDKDSEEWVYSKIFEKYYDIPDIYVNKRTLDIVQIRNGVVKCPKQSLKEGYLVVGMCTNENKQKLFGVHRILLFTLGTIPEKYKNMSIGDIAIDHIDTDKTNNNLKNLRFCTNSENCHFKIEQGVSKHSEETKRKIGEARKGKIHSEETKRKMCEAHRRLSSEKRKTQGTPLIAICIEDGVSLNAYSTAHMSELLGVGKTTIWRFVNSGKPLLSKINNKTYIIQKAPKV